MIAHFQAGALQRLIWALQRLIWCTIKIKLNSAQLELELGLNLAINAEIRFFCNFKANSDKPEHILWNLQNFTNLT
jgi:hypothetical protein